MKKWILAPLVYTVIWFLVPIFGASLVAIFELSNQLAFLITFGLAFFIPPAISALITKNQPIQGVIISAILHHLFLILFSPLIVRSLLSQLEPLFFLNSSTGVIVSEKDIGAGIILLSIVAFPVALVFSIIVGYTVNHYIIKPSRNLLSSKTAIIGIALLGVVLWSGRTQNKEPEQPESINLTSNLTPESTSQATCNFTRLSSDTQNLSIDMEVEVQNTFGQGLACRLCPGRQDYSPEFWLKNGEVVYIKDGPVSVAQDEWIWWEVELAGGEICWAAEDIWLAPK